MMSWGGVRTGCSSTLSGGRRGRLQARISSRFCPSACACVPTSLLLPCNDNQGHTLALGEVDQRERVGCRFVVLDGLSKLESVEREK
jgi:hypothetical protein